MADPTQAQVQDVAGIPTSSTGGIASAITVAVLMVNEVLAGSGLSAATLDNIKLYLACHLATLSQEKGALYGVQIGDVHQRFHNVYDKGLASTRFGQTVMLLDTTGKFAAINSGVIKPTLSAQFSVIKPVPPTGDEDDFLLQ